ncbi:MAG: hypothetical protein ACLFTT_14345 [Candidatus Hydrogenedentota bacterium]
MESTHEHKLPRFADSKEAARLLIREEDAFAVFRNPGCLYPPYEVAPLASKVATLRGHCAAILMDMDGTTTSTEEFCCRAMEETLRRMSGASADVWPGLDTVRDYPALIGYSGADNMRYLFDTYRGLPQPGPTMRSFLCAAAWGLGSEADPEAAPGVRALLAQLGMAALLSDPRFAGLCDSPGDGTRDAAEALAQTLPPPPMDDQETFGRMGLVIYARQYHRLLNRLDDEPPGALVKPLSGVGVFLALVKGVLGDEGGALAEALCAAAPACSRLPADDAAACLASLARRFTRAPARLALVTSSTAFEASRVLHAVFRALRAQVDAWPVSGACRRRVRDAFASPETCYDAIVTSSETAEMRLKPWRDPYSQALHRIGVGPADFNRVVGFEDTEPGVLSLRAAGVGCAVALPFEGTEAHDFSPAAYVCPGGLPEVLLHHGLFLPPEVNT